MKLASPAGATDSASPGKASASGRSIGRPVAAVCALVASTYGRRASRRCSSGAMLTYASAQYSHGKFSPWVGPHASSGSPPSRRPWKRKSGVKAENWLQRVTSSHHCGSVALPPR